MAIFGFRGQDREFKQAKKEKQQRMQRAQALRDRQIAMAAAPQRPVTPAAAGQTPRNIGGTGFRKAQTNVRQTTTLPGAQVQEVGPEIDDRGRPVQKKAGRQTFTSPPSQVAEIQAKSVAEANRARARAAGSERIPGTKARDVERVAPAEAPKVEIDTSKPQRSTASRAALEGNAAETARLKTIAAAQGANTEAGVATNERIAALEAERAGLKGDVKPSLDERRATTARNIEARRAGLQAEGVASAQAKANRAGTVVGDAINTAQETGAKIAKEVGDTPRNKARAKSGLRSLFDSAVNSEAGQRLKGVAQKSYDAMQGAGQQAKAAAGLESSEVPEAPKKTKAQAAADKVKGTAGKAGATLRNFGSTVVKPVTGTASVVKNVVKTPLSPKVAGPIAALTASADIDQYLRNGGELKDLPKEVIQGVSGAVGDEKARLDAIRAERAAGGSSAVESGLYGLATPISNAVELGLNAGEGVLDLGSGLAGGVSGLLRGAPIEGFRNAYDTATAERGFLGRSADTLDRNMGELAQTISGGRYQQAAAPGVEPVAAQPPVGTETIQTPGQQPGAGQAAAQVAEKTLVPNSNEIGTSGFRRPQGPPGPNDGYSALGPRGSFMTSDSPGAAGGGTFSEVSGPAGAGASVADNVAAYDRQTEAVRGLRNAQRASQGYKPVGERTFEGIGRTGTQWKDELRQRNMLRSMPQYDPGLTPKQNNARLLNWQAGVDQENIQRGINPRTGKDFNNDQGSIRDQIAAANLQRQTAKDAFDMSMKKMDMVMKDRDFMAGVGKEERAAMESIQESLASGDEAQRNQAYNSLVQSFFEDPGSKQGKLAIQTFATLAGKGINDERGIIDWMFGALGWGPEAIPESAYTNPAEGMALLQKIANSKEGGVIPWARAFSAGGSNYAYADNLDPAARAGLSAVTSGLRR